MNIMKAVTPYRIPIRLWSTVVIQDQTPVGWTGRFGIGSDMVVILGLRLFGS